VHANPKDEIFAASARIGSPLDAQDIEALLELATALAASGGELDDHDLDGVAGGGSLAGLDLQSTMRKSSKTLELLNSITKASSDTSRSVIRKIGG
jgi:hypothetical protein